MCSANKFAMENKEFYFIILKLNHQKSTMFREHFLHKFLKEQRLFSII